MTSRSRCKGYFFFDSIPELFVCGLIFFCNGLMSFPVTLLFCRLDIFERSVAVETGDSDLVPLDCAPLCRFRTGRGVGWLWLLWLEVKGSSAAETPGSVDFFSEVWMTSNSGVTETDWAGITAERKLFTRCVKSANWAVCCETNFRRSSISWFFVVLRCDF